MSVMRRRIPFRADSAYGILRRITDNEPRPIREINPQIPDWLCHVIEKLHSKSSDDRYSTAEEVSDLLQRCLVHEHSPNTPLPAELRTTSNWQSWPQRPGTMITIATTVVVVASAIYFGTPPVNPSPNEHPVSGSAQSFATASNSHQATDNAFHNTRVAFERHRRSRRHSGKRRSPRTDRQAEL